MRRHDSYGQVKEDSSGIYEGEILMGIVKEEFSGICKGEILLGIVHNVSSGAAEFFWLTKV